jgi:CBS domain-containing membrane protein
LESIFGQAARKMSWKEKKEEGSLLRLEVSDADIREAMKEIPGYLDITPADLKEVYSCAYRHAFKRITDSVKARDLMTATVYTVQRDTLLRDVAEIMAKNGISGVPVIDADMRVMGIISEKDFCSSMGDHGAKSLMAVIADCLQNQGCFAMTIREKKAEDIMTRPAITVSTDATLTQIKAVLADHNINRVPVIDSQGHLVGIISRADIVRFAF